MEHEQINRRLKVCLGVFMALLVLSGLTAFPLETELSWLKSMDFLPERLESWIAVVHAGLRETNTMYPFLAYGTDWLAFAHLAIAVFFIGPLRDPVRNKWILEAGMIISAGIFPLAFIAGNIRSIPFYWQLIDCSFGVFSFLLLGYCLHLANELEVARLQKATPPSVNRCPFAANHKQNLRQSA